MLTPALPFVTSNSKRASRTDSKRAVWPIFERGASRLMTETETGMYIDILPHVQFTMGEATLSIFFGEVRFPHVLCLKLDLSVLCQDYASPELTKRAVDVAESIAELMGLFQNQSYLALHFPRLWRIYTWSVYLRPAYEVRDLKCHQGLGGSLQDSFSSRGCAWRQDMGRPLSFSRCSL